VPHQVSLFRISIRSVSRRPRTSNRHNSTLSACSEKGRNSPLAIPGRTLGIRLSWPDDCRLFDHFIPLFLCRSITTMPGEAAAHASPSKPTLTQMYTHQQLPDILRPREKVSARAKKSSAYCCSSARSGSHSLLIAATQSMRPTHSRRGKAAESRVNHDGLLTEASGVFPALNLLARNSS